MLSILPTIILFLSWQSYKQAKTNLQSRPKFFANTEEPRPNGHKNHTKSPKHQNLVF